jgi:NAD(P)-dependent dehydrogenase (short-subunit alcohol dehydrogenase family)
VAERAGLLSGSVCVVTGGARGIGRAICERYAEEGADVVICDLLDDAGEELRDQLRSGGARAEHQHLDVTDRGSVEAALAAALASFGRIDVLAANAGVLRQAPVLDMDESMWRGVLEVNLTGVFHCCQVFGRQMVEQGTGGRIVIASSIGGIEGGAFYGAYAASKFAVIGLAQSLAVELAPHKVLVNCVCPGSVDTGMMEQLAREQAAATGRAESEVVADNMTPIALGRYATPREVADVYVFLASPLASYITGQRIVVDGGMLVT